MKRIIVLVALLAAASGCAQEAGNTNTTNTANANASPVASPSPTGVSLGDARAREEKVWDALKTKNWDAFRKLISDDHTYVTGDGIYNHEAAVEGVKKLNLTEVTLTDWKVVNADADAYVVTYTVQAKGDYDGQPLGPKPTRESTAWVKRADAARGDGGWVAVYHQDSEVVEPPQPAASPGSGSNSNSAPAASPAASPAAGASPSGSPASGGAAASPTDSEKQVWAALQRKDWAAFESYLAEEQIEVEPVGVNSTRAETLAGVKQFDFSGATLSDFKEVKIDTDAALVIYTVKATGPGWNPGGERHTTLWSNRNGRWRAVFHQGTYITK